MARLMCPYCGWAYDPGIDGTGYDLVPNHWYKAEDCPGQNQHPRNAETDRRPLWRDEQETKMYEAVVRLASDHEKQLCEIAKIFGKDAAGFGSITEMVRQEVARLKANLAAADTAHQYEQQRAEHFEEENERLKLMIDNKDRS